MLKMSTLTCISCKLLFSRTELHNEHYKTNWHQYNLKRKVHDLKPVSKEEFDKRVAAYKEKIKDKEELLLSVKCKPCGKHFTSENSLLSHLKSKRHVVAEAIAKIKPKVLGGASTSQEPEERVRVDEIDISEKNEDKADDFWNTDDDDSDWESYSDEDAINRTTADMHACLFCDYETNCTEKNVKHMLDAHSFFIPDIEYVSDIEAYLIYLAGKIIVGKICLWCNGKGKIYNSIRSVRQHMINDGHCKLLFEGDTIVEYADFYNYSSSDAEKEVFDEEILDDMLIDSDFDRVLPSGSIVGYHYLDMYYKQNLKQVTIDNHKKVKSIIQHYKAKGYLGANGSASAKKARDIVFLTRMKSRYNLKVRGKRY